MGRLKRLALWGCAVLMAVTAVAAGEADPAWATSPTDTADAPGARRPRSAAPWACRLRLLLLGFGVWLKPRV